MVTTDACLPSAASGEASLGFPLLVNYDVPKTKEAYARRARVALGGGKGGAGRGGIVRAPGVVVTLVVADDETELLREVCGDSRVETMPVSALEEVAMTRAPAASANCMANIETPPVPSVSTVCPAISERAPNSAFHAVTPAQGSVAACS